MPIHPSKTMKDDYIVKFCMQHEQYQAEYAPLSDNPYAMKGLGMTSLFGGGKGLEAITDANFAKLMNGVLQSIFTMKEARFYPEFAEDFPTEETNLVVKLFLMYNQLKK